MSYIGLPQPDRNIGIIIQARMGSMRFPGKIMALLDGKPVLHHVVARCLQALTVNTVVLAMPMLPSSTVAANYVSKYLPSVKLFYGSELDVLDRYYSAAKHYKLTHIVRITADCPFVNPTIITKCLNMLVYGDELDYVSNVYPERTFDKGLDVECFTFDLLEVMYLNAETPDEREHVTLWAQGEELINKGLIKNTGPLEGRNWCIDSPHDIQRCESYIAEFKQNEKDRPVEG